MCEDWKPDLWFSVPETTFVLLTKRVSMISVYPHAHELCEAVERMRATLDTTHRDNTCFTFILNYALSTSHSVQEVFVTETQDQNMIWSMIVASTF